MVFHWSLSDSKSPQVSRTLLSILAVLNNAVVWMVSTRPPTSKSSSPFSNPLVTVPNAPITIGIIVTCMFHSFFSSLARPRYLSFFSHFSVLFCGPPGQQSRLFCKFSFFFFCCWLLLRSGLLAGIRWSVCILKSHRSLCVSFSRTGAGLCIYHLLVWSNLNFLHISQWITLPTQFCLAFYSCCANLLHSLIIWLMVSSLSPHSLHLLFCCVLSILALIWLVLMALSCAAIKRDYYYYYYYYHYYYYYYYLLLASFLLRFLLIVFQGNLSDSKSAQVSRILLGIPAVLSDVEVWMVSTRPLIFKSSSPFNNSLVTVPKAPIMYGIIVTLMFRSFFNSLARSRYLSFFSFSFSFLLWLAGTAMSTILQILLLLLSTIRSGLLAEIRWSVYMSKSHRSLYELFSRTGVGLCIFVWSNLNFLHISQWITLPTQSCLVLYSFCANLLYSLNMWLMVSSLLPNNLHLLFCCVLSIPALIWLVLMALFCTAIRKYSFSLIKFPFLSHVQVFSCEMFISRLKRQDSCFSSHFCFLVIVILLVSVLSVSFLVAVISPPSCFSM